MTNFLQLLFQGIALGSVYALVALGFTIVFRASHVINFAQGAMLVLGCYLVSWLAVDHGMPFLIAIVIAVLALAGIGIAFQQVVLARVSEQPPLVLVMITIGLSAAIGGSILAIFGDATRLLGDPWRASASEVAGITFNHVKLWAIGSTVVALLAFFVFDRRSRFGLAMRAAASDHEAAAIQGVPVERVHALAWAMAGALGTIGGVFLAGFPNTPSLAIGDAALRAFPAVVLGGLGSPVGAVVGGMIIGVVEVLTSGYAPESFGANVSHVAPYIVMVAILLVLPYGLFGRRPAERI